MSAHPNAAFEVDADSACFEFVSHGAPDGEALPVNPGQVLRDDTGRPLLLHFAPRRWLVPAPDAALVARLSGLAAQGRGTLVDVEGKWRRLRPAGAGAVPAIASTISVESVLRDRECAAVSLFDSPVILARKDGAFDLWVAASYVGHFVDVTRNLKLPT
jgi:hypothetical protein